MKKKLLLLFIPLLLQNCFDKELTIFLKSNGSGTITERVKVDIPDGLKDIATKSKLSENQSESKSREASEKAAKEEKELKQKEAMEVTASRMGEGVKLLSFQEREEGNTAITEVVFSFQDINQVKLNSGMQMGAETNGNKEAEITFQYDTQKPELKISFKPHKKEKKDPDSSEKDGENNKKNSNPEMEKMMKNIFKKLRMAFIIKFEKKMDKTDSSYPDYSKNTVTLYDISFAKVLEMSEKDKKLMEELSENNAEALYKIAGIRFERKELITVGFKK